MSAHYRLLARYTDCGMKTNWCHYFIRILLGLYMFRVHRPIFRRVRTAVHTTIGSVSVRSGRVLCMLWHASRADRYWTNGCVNSCTNSPEDGPVGPKHVETQQYTNKIVTSIDFHSIRWKDALYKKLKKSTQTSWSLLLRSDVTARVKWVILEATATFTQDTLECTWWQLNYGLDVYELQSAFILKRCAQNGNLKCDL